MKTAEKTLSRIGLDYQQSAQLAGLLNDLLANYSTFYQNARGYHWNIQGEKFFELHLKFEDLYNELFLKIDEVAERILTLGFKPEHQFSKYLDESTISESTKVDDGVHSVRAILESYQILIAKQRKVLEMAVEIGDEGTNALMSDYIGEQEKKVWMYAAFLRR
ncbi:Dps family protein [Flagellimonas sp.]|uniref:Dps family protein n=1 Tax=Flagellimonas sp. TaxID=2058762 RepID=UPI003AB6EC75